MPSADVIPFASACPSDEEEDEESETESLNASKRPQMRRSESMYTKLLQQLIETVLGHESHLFSSEELGLLERLNNLSYHSRYLLVRLSLRSRSRLHRLSDLVSRYSAEIGDNITPLLDELCDPIAPPCSSAPVDSSSANNHANPCGTPAPGFSHPSGEMGTPGSGPCSAVDKVSSRYLAFAEDESAFTTEELLKSLKFEELKAIGLKMKVFKTGMSRHTLIASMLQHADRQATLPCFYPKALKPTAPPPYNEPPRTPERPRIIIDLITPPSNGPKRSVATSQMSRLRMMILEVERRFIRVSEDVFELLQRLNLVYFRCTELSSNSILLPLILSKSRRRHYPPCAAQRTCDIFPTRDALLRYEEALRIEEEMDRILSQPLEGGEKPLTRSLQAKSLYDTFHGKWQQLCNGIKDIPTRHPALERFEEGHVLTRIMYKGADALAKLHMYEEEVALLRELLSQKRWRKGKRGAWYDRLALVHMRHQSKPQEALQVVIESLKDPFTHVVYRPQLERRLTRLENILKIPQQERHEYSGTQRNANKQKIYGKRVQSHNASDPLASGENTLFSILPQKRESHTHETQRRPSAIGTHSMWAGKNDSIIRVEELALEHYEGLGYRGYHSEGRIVHHMFLLLFWSIIFQSVPGAFETPFQRGPLDLGFDSFFYARATEIERRLQEIENGEGPRIVAEVDDRERPTRTFGVGAKWDAFTKEDIIEAAKCIGGPALSVICRVLCEDYSHRSSGVPDLLVWNISSQKALFVEVKGPGDTLMEHQKVWIDVLLQAKAGVEVCYVEDEGIANSRQPKEKARGRTVHQKEIKTVLSGQEDTRKCLSTEKRTEAVRAPAVRMPSGVNVILIQDSDDEELPHPDVMPSRKRYVSESATKNPILTPSAAASKKIRLSSIG